MGSLINCGPILSWLELDNRGHHLLVADGDHCAINTPAVAAAYSVRKYTAHASDEISFDVSIYIVITIWYYYLFDFTLCIIQIVHQL